MDKEEFLDSIIVAVTGIFQQLQPALTQLYHRVEEEYEKAGSPLGEGNAMTWLLGLAEKRKQLQDINEIAQLSQDLGMYD